MDLSICIVNWNTRPLLRDCLLSLQAHVGSLASETIVVDNASADGSAELVRRAFPWARLIANQENYGFAYANNQAIAVSSGRYILLLNPDTVVKPGALPAMVRFLDTQSAVGALGCKLLNADGSLQHSIRTFPTVLTPFTENPGVNALPIIRRFTRRARLVDWPHDSLRDVDQVAGAALMVRRTVVDAVGPLDDGFHMWFEDVDWCYRIKRAGWRVCYLPDAEIVHYGGQSAIQRPDAAKVFYRSLFRYYGKSYGRAAQLGTRLVVAVGGLGIMAAGAVVGTVPRYAGARRYVGAGRVLLQAAMDI